MQPKLDSSQLPVSPLRSCWLHMDQGSKSLCDHTFEGVWDQLVLGSWEIRVWVC